MRHSNFVFCVDPLMTTWPFFMALHLWIVSMTNIKPISIFAGCIEYLSFLSWNQFCYSSLHFEFRISHFLTAFGGNFWALSAWVWLWSICAESLMTLKILLGWKFSNGIWRWQNWFVVGAGQRSPKITEEVVSGSTLPPYSYDFPELYVQPLRCCLREVTIPSDRLAGGDCNGGLRRFLDKG